MSWNIKFLGEKKAVRHAVETDKTIPEPVKAAILAHLGDIQDDNFKHFNGVRVEGYGHTYSGPGSYVSNIGKLEIEPVEILLPTPQITPVEESNVPEM